MNSAEDGYEDVEWYRRGEPRFLIAQVVVTLIIIALVSAGSWLIWNAIYKALGI